MRNNLMKKRIQSQTLDMNELYRMAIDQYTEEEDHNYPDNQSGDDLLSDRQDQLESNLNQSSPVLPIAIYGKDEGDHSVIKHHALYVPSSITQVNAYTSDTPPKDRETSRTVESHETSVSLSPTIQTITELWRRRQAWHRAEKSLTLQIKSFCRRICDGDKEEADKLYKAIMKNTEHPQKETVLFAVLPLLVARSKIEPERKQVEKQLLALIPPLPGYDFVCDTPGLSPFSLAALIGECPGVHYQGFLDFKTYQQVWKRMGVAVMEDGTRQRRVKGAEAIKHGYVAARRSVLWTIGDSLIKKQGPYRELYLRIKKEEVQQAENKGLMVVPAAKIPSKNPEKYISEGYIHNRAKRRMEKELLKDLWQLWRRSNKVFEDRHKLIAA